MRPTTPPGLVCCGHTVCAPAVCVLCAKSCGGLTFNLLTYSVLVIGTMSEPTLAVKDASPSLKSRCSVGMFGCTPKVLHGCEPGGTLIGSTVARLYPAFVRVFTYCVVRLRASQFE